MILFFDTETTGFPNNRAPAKDRSQPHLVQLGALLTDNDGNEIDRLNQIVRPDGWEIPEQASNIHGITTEYALKRGKSYSFVLSGYANLLRQADVLVCHNAPFDMRILNIAYMRIAGHEAPVDGKTIHCTMRAATPICRILHKSPRHAKDYKWPKLEECIHTFFGEKLDGAHDAMVDVLATKRVFFHLRDERGVFA